MVEGEKSLPPAGNVRAPSVTSWVLEEWGSLPDDMVTCLFKKCGISYSIDGIEDDILWEDANPEQESEDKEHEEEHVYDNQVTKEQRWSLFRESDDEDEFEGF